MIGNRSASRLTLRTAALGYLLVLVMAPVGLLFYRTFEHGLSQPLDAITSPDAVHAIYLTLITVAIAVPLNTIFGVGCALLLVRHNFRGRWLLNSIIDLPFALSPIVIGLSIVLVFGIQGWFGQSFVDAGFPIVYAVPAMVIACIFVSLPFVVRETIPVLREVGYEQEEAAETLGASGWQTFWRVTLPSIRWGVGYGVVLTTARVLGEFGAVTVVSGNILGQTQTLPLWVGNEAGQADFTGAYAGAIVLALLAFTALFLMNRFKPKEGTR